MGERHARRGNSKEGVGRLASRLADLAPGKHKEEACCSPVWRIGPDEVTLTPGKSRRTHGAAGTIL